MSVRGLFTTTLLSILALQLTGCEAIGTIFRAGMWVGVFGIVAVAVLVWLAVRLVRR